MEKNKNSRRNTYTRKSGDFSEICQQILENLFVGGPLTVFNVPFVEHPSNVMIWKSISKSIFKILGVLQGPTQGQTHFSLFLGTVGPHSPIL
jgi:hypothetical protein